MATLQVKGVPEDLHSRLRERAKSERMTMRDYVLRLIESDLRTATLAEWAEQLRRRGPIASGVDTQTVVEAIRQGRDERTDAILSSLPGRGEPDERGKRNRGR